MPRALSGSCSQSGSLRNAEDDRLAQLLSEHETWLTVERGLARNTVLAYRRDLRRYAAFVRSRGAGTDPGRIDQATVAAYAARLRDAPAKNETRKLASASVARALVAVRSFHRFCLQEGLLDTDPSERIGSPRVPAGIPKALEEAEIEALLVSVDGDDPKRLRDRAALETLYASGVRISELVGLDRGDLDLEGGLVRVLGKGGKERIVPIGRPAKVALDAYLYSGRPELARPRSGDALFLNVRGGRLTRQGCWQVVRRAAERVGLEEALSPHVLRHSCATHLLDHGADIRVVQELLGHARLSTTQVYTKVSPARLRAVYDAAHPRARPRAGSSAGR